MQQLSQILQAIIFSSPNPMELDDLVAICIQTDHTIDKQTISTTLDQIKRTFDDAYFGFELQETGSGFSFVSKEQYFTPLSHVVDYYQKKKLSKSAMETLSIIAFQKECTKMDIELIRGVSVDYAIDKLIEKELIEVAGRKDSPGQPLMYRITSKFLDYFGIKSIEELPRPNEISIIHENELGEITD